MRVQGNYPSQINRLSLRNNQLRVESSGRLSLPITDELVEFEKQPVEDEDFRKCTGRFLNIIGQNPRHHIAYIVHTIPLRPTLLGQTLA